MKNLTLYHSTSDYFLPSIKECGLGAKQKIFSWGILDFFKGIYPLCENYLLENNVYQRLRFTTTGMINQTVNDLFCFKHDRLYFSFKESTAIRYALSQYGSEILSRSIQLFKLLNENGYGKQIDKSMLKIDLNDIINFPHKKLLLKVNNIDPNILETEKGGCAIDKLKEMALQKKQDPSVFDVLSQQYNFATKETIDFKNIDVYEIKKLKTNGMEVKCELIKHID